MCIATFTAFHMQKEPLLLANVWNAHTAAIAEKIGYDALGTSSHAIALALGYGDGEELSFDELLFAVERILAAVDCNVSVDFEAGYSYDANQVANQAKILADMGVVGLNIEDGIVQDRKRMLGSETLLADKIHAINAKCEIFINARIDTYTTKHPNALEETIRRAKLYQKAGADGIFVPLMEKEDDIQRFVAEIDLPLNLFTTPNLPAFERLAELGVKRLSHGGKQYDKLMKESERIFSDYFRTKAYDIVL